MSRGYRPLGIDLFAGAGGMSLGFEQAGFDVVAAVELDPIHCATHDFNFPECRAFCDDAAKLDGRKLLRELGLKRGQIDVVFGGPPCQGFSLIGKRLSDDPRNRLLFHFLRLVDELRPKHFVMENVAGLTIGNARTVLEAFLEMADQIGYRVTEPCRVLNAAAYGVPQDRRRLFVLGQRRGSIAPTYPSPLTVPRDRRGGPAERMPPGSLPLCPSVMDAIGDLPDIEEFPDLLETDCVPFKPSGGSRYAKILRGEVSDRDDRSYPREFEKGLLTSSMRAEHTGLSRARFRATAPGEVEPVSRFFRLPPNGISNTLRAGTPSNRGAFTSPRPIHPIQSRCISVREAARLHSYPDWFRFHVTKWHGFRQIGNSVPVRLARAVANEVVHALGIAPKRPSERLRLGEVGLLSLDMRSAAMRYGVSSHVIEPRRRLAGDRSGS